MKINNKEDQSISSNDIRYFGLWFFIANLIPASIIMFTQDGNNIKEVHKYLGPTLYVLLTTLISPYILHFFGRNWDKKISKRCVKYEDLYTLIGHTTIIILIVYISILTLKAANV